MSDLNLVDKIARFIERFVFIKDRQIYRLLALWLIQTHFCKEFEYTGYVFAHSPEPESGKSRLLEIFDLLVANSSGLLYKPTDAILFRTADTSTQLLDEVDTWTNADSLRGILNAGFHRGGIVQRNEQQKNGKWKTVSFPVYGPRAMAGIGLGILHGTTKDRTFIVGMVKQTREERREKFRSRRLRPEAEQLKAEIAAWVKQNSGRIAELYDCSEETLAYLTHLRDRTIDIVEPLAAILEAVFAESLELEARRLELLESVSLTRKDGGEFVVDHKILKELERLANAEDPLVGSASELSLRCGLVPKPTEYDMAGTLRRYGFENHSVRMGDSVRYRYELQRERLAEICSRFAIDPSCEAVRS
jgi:putative DNA primase/helicase